MKTIIETLTRVADLRRLRLVGLVVMTCSLGLSVPGCADSASMGTEMKPKAFNSPEAAADALAAALRTEGTNDVMTLLGSEGQEIIDSGDSVADKQRRQMFLQMYDAKRSVTSAGSDTSMLVVGDTDWPFPVPLVKRSAGWEFDPQAGKEEILNRRIGQNELSAIEVCRAIADAQKEYSLADPDKDGSHEYAQQFLSVPGRRNGLFWPVAAGEEPSPLGDLIAGAAAEGYTKGDAGPSPYHGYYYRILQAQGPNAPGGSLQYVLDGEMTLGYAVLAYPAEYGNSGIMTFLMGSDGVVYQKDLGPNTLQIASGIVEFDPDSGWTKAK